MFIVSKRLSEGSYGGKKLQKHFTAWFWCPLLDAGKSFSQYQVLLVLLPKYWSKKENTP